MFTTIKVYACYAIKIYKNKPKNIFKQGCAGPGSAFDAVSNNRKVKKSFDLLLIKRLDKYGQHK